MTDPTPHYLAGQVERMERIQAEHDQVERDEPDAYMDRHGRVWLNLRKRRDGMLGVFDAESDCIPLWFTSVAPDCKADA